MKTYSRLIINYSRYTYFCNFIIAFLPLYFELGIAFLFVTEVYAEDKETVFAKCPTLDIWLDSECAST